jgi:hypothetical protein
MHYVMVSVSEKESILKPDGEPYLNTEKNWKFLQTASKHARYMQLVDPKAFVDNRNDDPHIYVADPITPPFPQWAIDDFYGFSLPSFNLYESSDFDLPGIMVSGYEYEPGEQPYYLEIWIEKTTQNDGSMTFYVRGEV